MAVSLLFVRNVVIWVLLNQHTRIKKNLGGKIENNNESSRATDACLTSSSEKSLGLARLQRVLSTIVALKGVVRVSKEISRIAAANLLSNPPCAYLFCRTFVNCRICSSLGFTFIQIPSLYKITSTAYRTTKHIFPSF